ncbi:MAG TPA: noncanonical pyrimidine nucleotidase, YjjG family [Spirochaeta sp.]|nr:noncanonical pyrimidine nucleotidase, YjjG family [Spirochaeta sp.]
MKYQLLIFDLDNTLFDYNKAENFALDKTLIHFGCSATAEIKESYREINEQTWQKYERGEITSEQLRFQRFESFGEAHGFDWDAFEVGSLYLKNLGLGGFILAGTEELLCRLKPDFRMAACTNGISDVQRSRLAHSPFEGFFEPLIISDEVGFAKPDPEIFRILLDKAGITDKSTVLMIGDSISSDISGAIAAGLPCCWYNPYAAEWPLVAGPDFIINELSDLESIVYLEE